MAVKLSERARRELAAIDRIRQEHRAAWRAGKADRPWPGDAGAELTDVVPCCTRRADDG